MPRSRTEEWAYSDYVPPVPLGLGMRVPEVPGRSSPGQGEPQDMSICRGQECACGDYVRWWLQGLGMSPRAGADPGHVTRAAGRKRQTPGRT